MNAKSLIALATLAAATTGFAQEAPAVSFPHATEAARAEVRAAARTTQIGEAPVAVLPTAKATLARATVKAEAAQAGRDRTLAMGELMGFEQHATHPVARGEAVAVIARR